MNSFQRFLSILFLVATLIFIGGCDVDIDPDSIQAVQVCKSVGGPKSGAGSLVAQGMLSPDGVNCLRGFIRCSETKSYAYSGCHLYLVALDSGGPKVAGVVMDGNGAALDLSIDVNDPGSTKIGEKHTLLFCKDKTMAKMLMQEIKKSVQIGGQASQSAASAAAAAAAQKKQGSKTSKTNNMPKPAHAR